MSQGLLLCLAGVHEARRAALPGAAEGPAGHRLAGLPAGLLHGTPGPAEIPQAQGETMSSVPATRNLIFETFVQVEGKPLPQSLTSFSSHVIFFVFAPSTVSSFIKVL